MPNALWFGLRFLGFGVGIFIGWQTGAFFALAGDPQDAGSVLFLIALAVGGIGYILGPHVSAAVFRRLRETIRSASATDLVAIGVGLAFGGLVSALLAVPLSHLPDPLGSTLPFVVAVIACGLAIAVTLLRKRDLVAPWVKDRTAVAARPVALLDTSVIIDGRVADLVRTGFLDARLQVPRFVLEELQHIADASDPARRARGRRGLDALGRLREEVADGVEIVDAEGDRGARAVDAKLVSLARSRHARIVTNDYNLARVAELQGVRVLNLNDLAGALRPPVVPGEELLLTVVQPGREAGQGVGFLDDGTMVVVDGGKPLIGQQTSVTVTRLLQTGAGRMVFAIPKHDVA